MSRPSREDLELALASLPRAALAELPTPLRFLPRFSDQVGRPVWIKRDDLTGLAFGGNKVRKLEFIMGSALGGSVDTVVTIGAPQSNHARSVAAAANVVGLECHLVLGGTRPSSPSGNLALDAALGATLHFAGTDRWDVLQQEAEALSQRLTASGKTPLVVPIGGSTELGAAAFAAAYLELVDQLTDLDLPAAAVVHATSTGGTQAGLQFANAIVPSGLDIIGIGVAKTPRDLTTDIVELMGRLGRLLDIRLPDPPTPEVVHGYLGPAYAVPSQAGQRALGLLARTESIFTDPVYSAKALAAVVDMAKGNDSTPLVFWHTGGQPALFSDSVGLQSAPVSALSHREGAVNGPGSEG